MLGDQLKYLRITNKITQVELARKLNVSKQSICNWENNNIMPSIDMLKKLCLHFSCTADFLLELELEEELILDATQLTIDQANHIRQIIKDYEQLNTLTVKKR